MDTHGAENIGRGFQGAGSSGAVAELRPSQPWGDPGSVTIEPKPAGLYKLKGALRDPLAS